MGEPKKESNEEINEMYIPQPTRHKLWNSQPTSHGTRDPQPTSHGTRDPQPTSHGIRDPQPTSHGTRDPQPTSHGTRGPQPTSHGTRGPQPTSHGTRHAQLTMHQPLDLRTMVRAHTSRDSQLGAQGPWNLQRMTYKSQDPPPRVSLSRRDIEMVNRSSGPYFRACRPRASYSRADESLDSSSRDRGPMSSPFTRMVTGAMNSQPRYRTPDLQPGVHGTLDPSHRIHRSSDPRQKAYESLGLPHRTQQTWIGQHQCLTINLNLQDAQIGSTSETKLSEDNSDHGMNVIMSQRNLTYAHISQGMLSRNSDHFFQAMRGIEPVTVVEAEQESGVDVISPPEHVAFPYSAYANGRVPNILQLDNVEGATRRECEVPTKNEPSNVGPVEYTAATALQTLKESQEPYGALTTISELLLQQQEERRVRNSRHDNDRAIPITLCSNELDLAEPEEISRNSVLPYPSTFHNTRYPITSPPSNLERNSSSMNLKHVASSPQTYSPMYSPAFLSTFSRPFSQTNSTSEKTETHSTQVQANPANAPNSSTFSNSMYGMNVNSRTENVSAFPDRYSTPYPFINPSVYSASLFPSYPLATPSSMTTPNLLTAPPQKKFKKSLGSQTKGKRDN